jgi:hypothetical protein
MTRKRYQPVLIVLIIGSLTLLASAGDANHSGLRRPVSVPAQRTPLSGYLLDVFRNAKLSGGIVIVADDCEEQPQMFPEFKGTVKEVLDRLASMDKRLNWSELGEQLVVRNTSSIPPVLKVTLHEFRFSRKDPLTRISSNLLGSPEVQDEIRTLHLVERGPEFGFAQFSAPSTEKDNIILKSTTVLDALNSAAGDRSVWFYRQSNCERNEISLNWPIR